MSRTPPWSNARTASDLKNSPKPNEASPPHGGDASKYRIAGISAGIVNGLFGGGGGIPLLFLLNRWAKLDEKKAFATCVAVIFPLCAVSAVIYLLHGSFQLAQALPYLAGGLAGGVIGGRLFRSVPNIWLRRVFALFLLYGAWRYLT